MTNSNGGRNPGSAKGRVWRHTRSILTHLDERLRRYLIALFGPASWSKRLWLVTKGAVTLVLLAAGLVLIYALLLIPFTPGISDIQKAKQERPTTLLSADGEVITVLKPVNREWISLEDVPQHVIDALISTEDHRFYRHHGIDGIRIFGAAWYTLTGRVQGGSTITQQLARNLYVDEIGRARSATRKLKEAITATKIEFAYTKEEILETYLNTVPFLYNAYGIEMAARTYFGKSASELTVLEGATLVGMLKGTYYYNPVRNPNRALSRRNVVLAQMMRHDHLDEATFDELSESPLETHFERQPEPDNPAPHYTDYLRQWLVEWADRNGYNLYRDSLVVHTTLDLELQRFAQASVTRWGNRLEDVAAVEWNSAEPGTLFRSADSYRSRRGGDGFNYLWNERHDLVDRFIRATPQYRRGIESGVRTEDMIDSLRADATFMEALRKLKSRLEAGFLAMDPETGAVKAWVGSRDYDLDQFDHVAVARRQPGSTFKPFVYASALEAGYRPNDELMDAPIEIRLAGGEVWQPQNAGGFSDEEMTLVDGLVYSKNSISARLIDDVGARSVARVARRMGVQESSLEEVPSLALGTSNVTLLEMVNAYATFARGGMHRPPMLVDRIEDRTGRVVYESTERPRRAVSERTALAVTDMMRDAVDRGTGQRIRSTFGIRADVAGKTGTTQNNTDGWFILMHPDLVAGAWIGFNDPAIGFRSSYWGQGGNNALLVVGDFFRRSINAGKIDSDARFPDPLPYDEPSDGFFRRIGNWIASAASSVADGVATFFRGIFGGDGDGDVRTTDADSEPPVYAASEDDTAVADSLTRLARESTQLNRYIEEIRAQREAREPEPPEVIEEEVEQELEEVAPEIP